MNRKIDSDKPINPFIKNNKLNVLIKNSEEKKLIGLESIPTGNEIIEHPEVYGLTKTMLIDPVKHMKIFMFDGIEEMFDMPKAAIKTLFSIGKKLQWNQDLIKISLKAYSEQLGMSQASVANGLNILIDNGFLCKYKRGYYWINPQVFFYGDRIKTYPNNLNQL